MPTQINHVAIYASNIYRTSEFYQSIFGAKETERKYTSSGRIRMLRLSLNDKQCIELFNYDDCYAQPSIPHVTSGYMHIGYFVSNVEDYIKKVSLIEQDFIGSDGIRRVFLRDPENNQIELIENKI